MSQDNGRVAGKVAVITGASSGIGRASFELFGREGAKVVATARTESKLQEGLDAVRAAGGEAIVVPADLVDDSTPDKVMQAALDEYGRIDSAADDARAGQRLDRQRRQHGRADRALRRPRLHRGQGRDHQPHPLAGDHLRQTGRPRQLRLPRLHRYADDRTGDRPLQGRRDPVRDGAAGPGRDPQEMAYAILYLGSDESSYCIGTALLADGGCTSRSFPAG